MTRGVRQVAEIIECRCAIERCKGHIKIKPRVVRGKIEIGMFSAENSITLDREGVEATKAALDVALKEAEGAVRE